MSKILSIDPSSTEVGLYDGERAYTIVANKKKPRPERLAFIMQHLSSFIAANGPYDFVVYEEQFTRGGAATKALFGAVGVLEAVSITMGAGVMPIPQGTLRKWAMAEYNMTGVLSSKASKELYEKIARHYDPRVEHGYASEHEMDAAAMYYFIQAEGEIQ